MPVGTLVQSSGEQYSPDSSQPSSAASCTSVGSRPSQLRTTTVASSVDAMASSSLLDHVTRSNTATDEEPEAYTRVAPSADASAATSRTCESLIVIAARKLNTAAPCPDAPPSAMMQRTSVVRDVVYTAPPLIASLPMSTQSSRSPPP